MDWPKHIALTVTHNDHATSYETAAQAIANGTYDHADWASDEEKARAIEADSVWVIQWYPSTPVGFCAVAASTFEAALAAALTD